MPAAGTPLVIAAVGDVHGHHHQMVALVEQAAAAAGVRPDLVVQVGDFEPHRHEDDVQTMAAPARFRKVGDFPDFREGRARFPWPVLFVGGNHEPYGFLDGLAPGAEVAPGCRWLGRAGLVEHCGLKVAGLSGIFREDCWVVGRPPFGAMHREKKKRYVGFTQADVDRLLDLAEEGRPDLLLLHEWPRLALGPAEVAQLRMFVGDESNGDDDELPDLRRVGAVVGSAQALELALLLEPRLVLCGHVHAPLRATLPGGIPLRALANVEGGVGAVALFLWRAGGGFEELVGP
ncbi:MAG: metallophosphoesterase [Pseudomonadota bacterium]